jgi:hypothetical protein
MRRDTERSISDLLSDLLGSVGREKERKIWKTKEQKRCSRF